MNTHFLAVDHQKNLTPTDSSQKKRFCTSVERQRHTLGARNVKNKKCVQQTLLIMILNKHCDITYERPKKVSNLTRQFFHIKTLNLNNELFDVEDFLNKRTVAVYENALSEGLSKKNATRRLENEKSLVLLDFLMDVALEFGYFFTTSKLKKKSSRAKVDFIEEVYYNHSLIVNLNEFQNQCLCVNEYLHSLTTKSTRKCTLVQNDSKIASLIKTNSLFHHN
ncbi:TATA-binding protein-associated phosphoprotein [Entamoeba marina]